MLQIIVTKMKFNLIDVMITNLMIFLNIHIIAIHMNVAVIKLQNKAK